MNAKERRQSILLTLKQQLTPISATALAELFSVSRQAIVGDIGILRAENHSIFATTKGYLLESQLTSPGYIGKVVSYHTPAQTKDELYIIVDGGGTVLDVSVEHEIYGELVGSLSLSSRSEVDAFITACEEKGARLLTELTNGVHLHNISCENREVFEKIKQTLGEKGFLYSNYEESH